MPLVPSQSVSPDREMPLVPITVCQPYLPKAVPENFIVAVTCFVFHTCVSQHAAHVGFVHTAELFTFKAKRLVAKLPMLTVETLALKSALSVARQYIITCHTSDLAATIISTRDA